MSTHTCDVKKKKMPNRLKNKKFHFALKVGLRRAGSFSQENVDFLLDPFFVVWSVSVRGLLIDEYRQVLQLIDEVEELADVISDGRL